MEKVRVQKGGQTKVIPADQKNVYLSAGWGEVKKPTNVGGSSSKANYGNNKY